MKHESYHKGLGNVLSKNIMGFVDLKKQTCFEIKLSDVFNYIQHGIKKSNKVITGMFIQTKEN